MTVMGANFLITWRIKLTSAKNSKMHGQLSDSDLDLMVG